ncbi:cation-binding protein [archaeon CG_4_8_14_3_um_filter_38_5]|nr:MAG: cation-binding protein [archaeon CG07_land_8_20_14_0_80_38_8]PIU89060.1 MAG: cation-binding protein [archaeon CG06_land_8_20_14_3_00_37_11]PIX43896.1 MAG: cation-binding protein [archaeon CG_4_8_14_3_um_filter_38_5]
MEPYTPLMTEHELIRTAFSVVEKEIQRMEESGKANDEFVNLIADFFIDYIDISHHGKEENILFKALQKKKISKQHAEMMNILLKEHEKGRQIVRTLMNAADEYFKKGSQAHFPNIVSGLKDIVYVYKEHIKKEDNEFFVPVMDYFTESEKEEILKKFWQFDVNIIHEKYKNLFEAME